eukprot:159242_1
MAFDLFTIVASFYVITATIGWLLARWTIKQYDKAPHYSYITNSQKYVYSSRGLNEKSDSNISPDDEKSKLQTRLPHYEGPNPFTIKKLSNYERFKIYFFCITGIALFRFISFIFCAFCLYLISLPITMCASPNGFMHIQLVKFIRYWIGIALFLFGFYFINVSDSRNKNTSNNEPIRVIVLNHNTIFDGLVILWKTNGVIAAKKEISKAPIFGRILNALQTLWIDRSGAKGRNYAKQQIIDHVTDYKQLPLIIFPQGTCSNVHTVTSFKTGAYLPKEKVLEIALDWSGNASCDLSFVSNVHVLAHILHVACCQFINYCHIDYKNEHIPTIKEQEDSLLFAENSRQMVVESLNTWNKDKSRPIIATKHSYSDWKLLTKAFKENKNFDTSNILMYDIISNLRLRTKTVTYLAERFSKLDINKSGYIEYNEFCEAFNRDPNENSKQMKGLFNVFNTENKSFNKIGFEEFLVGVATCFMDNKIEDGIKIMFKGNESENDMGDGDDGKYILKDNVLNTYARHVDKNKFGSSGNNEFDKWLNKMGVFVDQVFGAENKLKYERFYEEIVKNKYEYMVQHYLQSIIMVRLKIKLTQNDFSIKNNTIYENPLAELVRSTSIQSVHQT